ncbi:40S ribosomal protein S15 [Striga asiatica]|uniref:40S ribosomal protein S15 n=1 Tax=Striga asiatica TaxID=4170 RepID=A0A5A7NYI4_STRAF|nr:40S ribosomal protein S15 [Striga asiatica]
MCGADHKPSYHRELNLLLVANLHRNHRPTKLLFSTRMKASTLRLCTHVEEERSAFLVNHDNKKVGGTNTRSPVPDWLVRNREFAKIEANHFRLDLDWIESFAIVHSKYATNHLRHNYHVPKVSPHQCRFLASWSLTLPSSGTGTEELDELISGHIKESIEVDSPEAELLERPLLRLPRRQRGLDIRLKTHEKRTL